MKDLLIQLNQRPIAIYPIYIRITGSVNAGLLLSQLMYWYGAVNGRIFYKSDSEIMEETCLSESELRTAKNKLKSMSFIDIKAKGVPARTHYFINPQELISEIRNFSSAKSTKLKTRNQQNYNSEFNETITENTTENTTKTKSDIYSENEFSHTEDEIKNPFTRQGFSDSLDADKVKKKEKFREKKEKAEPKQPSDIFVAYEMFCTFHESVSAAKYPRTLNGNYILNPIDARNVKLLLEWVEKINPDNKMDNFKVFVQAAWMLDDKYLKANFNIGLLYRQCTQIYAKVQNSNPILSKQKKEEQLNAEAAEFLRSRYGIVN
jgi:DNA-binding transcriptional regulator GbsR (MarR family)